MKKIYLLLLLTFSTAVVRSQTTVFYQGFENTSLTCTENWGYTGGNRNTETRRTGSYSGRIGRNGESNTLTFNTVNIAGLSNVTLQVYHSVRSGTGPGMDTREGAVLQVALNGGAWTNVGQVGGFGDINWGWSATPGGASSSSSGCTVYQCANPLNYIVPAGTNTIAFRVVSVTGGSCATFNTNMTNGTAANYDRTDEGIFIDDVRLTTTSTAIPGIWTGLVSTDWFDCNNWHNRIVPTASTNVTIDQTASNNCVVSGSGNAVCNNLSLSSSNGTNRDLTIQNTASLTCGGDISFTKSGGSGTLTLSVLNSATLTCNHFTVTGTASNADNAQFKNEINTTNVYVNGNFTLNNGGRLDLTNSPNWGTLHIKGNYSNNGLETDYKQTNSIIYFDGSGNQTVNTSGFTEVFANIVVNKPSGTLTFNTPANVENNINFTSGIVYTSAANLINLLDNATATNMSNTSFVDGPVRKTGDDAFSFPIGNGANYQPATISAPGNTSDHFTAQYFQANPHPTYNENSKDPTLDHISNCEYWIIDRTGGSSNVNVTLSWDANSCGVTNLGDLRVARWNGTMWKDHGNGGTTGTTSSGTIITSAAVTSFSPFTLASFSVENPLPVELLSFTGVCTEDGNLLQWITASEQNNAYFTLEKSSDGTAYEKLADIQGAGNSNLYRQYQYTDMTEQEVYTYYRLSQTDYDGSREIFTPIYLSCSIPASTTPAVQVYLVQPGTLKLTLQDAEAGTAPLLLTDASGRIIWHNSLELGNGTQQVSLPLPPLAAGIYTLSLQLGEHPVYARFFLP